VVPVVNPWGFNELEYKNYNGVNLNRNYDGDWVEIEDPTNREYGGAEPFDQVETQYIRSIVLANTDALYFCDFHTNGGTNVNSRANINWHSLCVSDDAYYNRLLYASNYHISNITGHFKAEFPREEDTLVPWGKISASVAHGVARKYLYTQNILASTFEGFCGFPWGDEFSENVIQANAELIGNWLMTVINEYKN
jgi:hypothetical protein